MAAILCPKCKTPLEIPKPAPEKVSCAKCGSTFRNAANKSSPSSNGSKSDNGAMASPHVAEKLAAQSRSNSLPVPVGAAAGAAGGVLAGAAVAQAMAEPRVAKNLAAEPRSSDSSDRDNPDDQPKKNKAALIIAGGAAGAILLFGLVVYLMVRGGGPAKTTPGGKDTDGPGFANKNDTRRKREKVVVDPKESFDKLAKDREFFLIPDAHPVFHESLTQFAKEKGIANGKIDLDQYREYSEQRNKAAQTAIEKGVEYLRSQIAPPINAGGRAGAQALAGLALLECDVPPDDPDVVKIANMIREAAPGMNNPYDIGPSIFFLDRLASTPTPEDLTLIKSLSYRLLAGQRRPMYLWRYGVPVLNPKEEEVLVAKVDDNTWQGPVINDQDMSCSQFAALGLWTAKRHGVNVTHALRKAAVTSRSFQDVDKGTWNYGATGHGGQFEDTSTCCGLILISLGQAVEENAKPILKDVAVINAFKHLESVIKRNTNPHNLAVQAHGRLYFLWAMERTALILNQDTIGEQDWHKWGTEIILGMQQPNGGWPAESGFNGVPDTAFALLFLQRVNLFKDLTDKLQGLGAWLDVPRDGLASNPPTQPRRQGS